jgi:hypothetical protein
VFVKGFEKKYGDEHPRVSLWMACELMTCETTMQFAYGMPEDVFKKVAKDFSFADLLTVNYVWLSKISTTTNWKTRLFDLFDEYPEIPLSELGLPNDWRNHPLWQ